MLVEQSTVMQAPRERVRAVYAEYQPFLPGPAPRRMRGHQLQPLRMAVEVRDFVLPRPQPVSSGSSQQVR